MIDICQWRAAIGLWSCRRSVKVRSLSDDIRSTYGVNRSSFCFAGIICFSVALRFLLILSGDVELNPGPTSTHVKYVRNKIEASLRNHFSSYHPATDYSVLELATSLYSNGIISSSALILPTTDKILNEFIPSLSSLHTILELTQHYNMFLTCLYSINGPHSLFGLTELVQDFKIIQESEIAVNQNYLEATMKWGSVKTLITKVIIQGEARVGKTCLKCLLVSEKYVDRSSTGCIEAPNIALYGHSGSSWKHVGEDELSRQVIVALQNDALDRENLLISADVTLHNEMEISLENELAKPETHDSSDASSTADAHVTSKVKKFHEKCKRLQDEGSSLTEQKQWLYFIDSGGQLEFQNILPAFMPCASVLILVVSLAKNLSDPSCTTMNISNAERESNSTYSLPVEEIIKKVASSVVSSARHYSSFIHGDLQKYITPPGYITPPPGALLSIIPVATHRDEYEAKRSEGVMLEESDRKVQKIKDIFQYHKSTCKFVSRDGDIILYEIDGRTAAGTSEVMIPDPVIEEISKALHENAYEIKVPLRWYCFNMLLQDVARDGCGVLSLSTCVELGQELYNDMLEDEVVSALKFLHFLNNLLYYPDSEECNDIVFIQVESLVGITKELIAFIYEKHEDVAKLDFRAERLVTRGQISVDILQQYSQNCVKVARMFDGFEAKLLKLFQELLIAAPLPEEGQYFMPALLPVKDVTKADKPFSNTTPLLYYFKDAVPMGLFCAFIAQLLSSKNSKLQWYIVEADWSHFSNYFMLKCRNLQDNFILIEQLNCIEVHCDGSKSSSLALARDDIKRGIMEAIRSHKLSKNVEPQEAFYCPCSKEKHILLLTQSITGEHLFTCTKDPRKHIDEKKSWLDWLNVTDTQQMDSVISEDLPKHFTVPLSIKNLNEVFRLLCSSLTKWKVLGLRLGVDYTELNKIKADNDDTDSCLMEMLAAWLKQSSKAVRTYKHLLDSLESIGERELADRIKRNLLKRKADQYESSSSKRLCTET